MRCEYCPETELQWNFFEKLYDCLNCGRKFQPNQIKKFQQKTLEGY